MGAPPAVLLLDDGELEDVHQLLLELRIPCARVRGGAIVQGTPAPKDLLVATPRRIDAVEDTIQDAVSPPIRVMVVREDSNALREQLRRTGFDFLVRRPVHPDALRLLLMHCVYKGEERRREARVAAGFDVTYRSGLLTRRATLLDLSLRGCRLRGQHRVAAGKRIRVELPEALDAGDPLSLAGRVARCDASTGAVEGYTLGVSFGTLEEGNRQALEMLIDDLSRGPATLRPTSPRLKRIPMPAQESPTSETPAAEAEATEAATPAHTASADEAETTSADERRGHARVGYPQTVPAFGNRALRVLVGRDLSVGGMRIEPQPELSLGDRLHLAIYGESGEEPMLLWGSVARDDGERGHVVLFDPVDPATAERLERIVTSLPSVESLHDSEADAMGTVLTEIVG